MRAVLTKSQEAPGSDSATTGASPPVPSANRIETAAYISDLSAHLATLARRDGFAALAYLLEMARLEAEGLRNGQSQ